LAFNPDAELGYLARVIRLPEYDKFNELPDEYPIVRSCCLARHTGPPSSVLLQKGAAIPFTLANATTPEEVAIAHPEPESDRLIIQVKPGSACLGFPQ
jgi:hypothetical protein